MPIPLRTPGTAVALMGDSYAAAAASTEPRALALLSMLAPGFAAGGWQAGAPYFLDETAGRLIWAMRLDRAGASGCLDVSVDLVIAEPYPGGTPLPEDAVGFNLRVTAEGGRPLLDWAGYNYARNLWVPAGDAQALDARWRTFEQAVLSTEKWLPETLAFAARL